MELRTAEERKILLLLLRAALVDDRVRELRRRERSNRERRVAVRELLEDDRVGDRRAVLAAATVLGGDLRAGEAEVPDALEEVVRDRGVLVALAADGADHLGSELAHRVTHEFLLF